MKYLLLILVLAGSAFGQQPDRWRGLVIDESTPEQAITILGKPKSEKKSDKMMGYRNKSIRNIGDLRILHWEHAEGFADVKLYFAAGTLAIIQLEKPKDKIPAKVFIDAYPGVDFEWSRDSGDVFYELEAITPVSKISAGVGNLTSGMMNELFGNIAQRGKINKLEGNVVLIFIQSRRMDDKRGVDALK